MLRGVAVRRLDVGAGVTAEAHDAQVEDRRALLGAHQVGELLGRPRRRRADRCRRRTGTASPDASRATPATHPAGVGTLMPSPLSSHTSSSGSGTPRWAIIRSGVDRSLGRRVVQRGVPEAAHGQGVRRPLRVDVERVRLPRWRRRRRAPVAAATRSSTSAGITASSALPNTLCRPPAIGSSAAARRPLRMSPTPSCAGRPAGPGQGRNRRSGSATAPGRWAAARRRRRRWPHDRPSRSCRSHGPRRAASGRRGRGGGWRPGRRTARRAGAT